MNLTPEQRLDILKLELGLIQATLDKYDGFIIQTRNWFITLFAGAVALQFTDRVSDAHQLATGLCITFWVFEGSIRHQYWFKYVERYRQLRDSLNSGSDDISHLSIYDLTNDRGTRKKSRGLKFRTCFLRLEPSLVYFTLAIGAQIIGNIYK